MWDNAKDKLSGVTANQVREFFDYNPQDGFLRWKISRQKIQKGAIAGYVSNSDGYRYVGFDYNEFLAHRIIWLWVTGEWPQAQIDHWDENRDNNRWLNLREATNSQNNRNKRRAQKNNLSTGIRGVDIRRGKYRVRVNVHGKEIVIGRFVLLEEARIARAEAEKKYFGQFSPKRE